MCVALFSSVLLSPSIVTCIPQHSQQVSEREREIERECVCVCVCLWVRERQIKRERGIVTMSLSRVPLFTRPSCSKLRHCTNCMLNEPSLILMLFFPLLLHLPLPLFPALILPLFLALYISLSSLPLSRFLWFSHYCVNTDIGITHTQL